MSDAAKTAVKELLGRNPKADPKKVKKAMEYLEMLENRGVGDYGYYNNPVNSDNQEEAKQRF